MVYDWDAHQETCYRLYIEEGKSLEDIMEHMKIAHKFAPSKRAFQTQFRRWNFPSKQKPAYKNDRLVARIRELWERNLAQRDMLAVLNDEGFDIKPRELMRVRTRNRWLLRVPNGDKPRAGDLDDETESLEEGSSAVDPDSTLDLPDEHNTPSSSQPTQDSVSRPSPDAQGGTAASTSEPEEKPGRKRRKRARQSADPSGSGARFPSEMKIDEARVILGLDTYMYRELRAAFQGICNDVGVVKKTLAGPERWEETKARLIRELAHLQAAMWMSRDNLESKKLALDVICTDVTKRMRTMEARMTLAEAKNALGVNPEESREIRTAFHRVLRDAKFACKSDATPEQWEGLKQRWGEESRLVRAMLDGDSAALDTQAKIRALEVLAKDVMKRLRDDRVRKEPKKNQPLQPSPTVTSRGSQDMRSLRLSQAQSSPSSNQLDMGDGMTSSNFDAMSEVSHASHMAFGPPSGSMATHLPMSLQSQESSLPDSPDGLPQPPRVLGSSMTSGMAMDAQVGSSLLLAANAQTAFMEQPYVQQQFAAATPPAPVFHAVQSVPAVFAVYLRLHPSSSFVVHTSLWIATMTSQSLEELRQAAVEKFPNALCMRVQGILRDGKGGEIPLEIEQDQELGAYLAHLRGGSTPTFSVQLVWKS